MKHALLALAALMLTSPLLAQDESGVSLTIHFADGTNRFHVGEIIPVEMSFRATIPDMYDMNTRNYDRSGRLNIEQFHVTPPGRDPCLPKTSSRTTGHRINNIPSIFSVVG